jgi:hypothetical protein
VPPRRRYPLHPSLHLARLIAGPVAGPPTREAVRRWIRRSPSTDCPHAWRGPCRPPRPGRDRRGSTERAAGRTRCGRALPASECRLNGAACCSPTTTSTKSGRTAVGLVEGTWRDPGSVDSEYWIGMLLESGEQHGRRGYPPEFRRLADRKGPHDGLLENRPRLALTTPPGITPAIATPRSPRHRCGVLRLTLLWSSHCYTTQKRQDVLSS